MHSNCILKTTNLSKKFGEKVAVQSINMSINKGDIYGLIGKNGAGKTTLMRLVLSLTQPTQGDIELFESKNFIDSRGKVGSLIETPGFYKGCTAKENILRFALLYGASEEDALNALKLVGLEVDNPRKVGKYSLGMKQRLGIAIALLGNPEFVILDEPVNGLDPEGMREVRELIRKLNAEHGITFLISSHLLDELSRVATRFGIISNGKLIDEFTADSINEKEEYKITLKVSNAAEAVKRLSESYQNINVTFDADSVVIVSKEDVSAQINRFLVKDCNIDVFSIMPEQRTIEQYYLEKVGAANE